MYHMHVGACGGQNRLSDALKLESQGVVSHCIGTANKTGSSGQRVRVLKRLSPGIIIFKASFLKS